MIPNLLTASRIFIAPVFLAVFLQTWGDNATVSWLWVCIGLLVLIELSDMFDGMAARAMRQVSDFGKYFDPFADSASRITIFLAFYLAHIIPLWMFLIFLYRDLFVVAVRFACIRKGVVVPARISGKLKAIFQGAACFCVLIAALLREYGVDAVPETVAGKPLGFFFMLAAALYTAYSAFDYYFGNKLSMPKL